MSDAIQHPLGVLEVHRPATRERATSYRPSNHNAGVNGVHRWVVDNGGAPTIEDFVANDRRLSSR